MSKNSLGVIPRYIGDSDSDTDIWNYVVEHGYRHYDEIVLPGECPEMVYLRIARCILKKGKYAYEERGDLCG